MTDFLGRLAERTLGGEPGVRPDLFSRAMDGVGTGVSRGAEPLELEVHEEQGSAPEGMRGRSNQPIEPVSRHRTPERGGDPERVGRAGQPGERRRSAPGREAAASPVLPVTTGDVAPVARSTMAETVFVSHASLDRQELPREPGPQARAAGARGAIRPLESPAPSVAPFAWHEVGPDDGSRQSMPAAPAPTIEVTIGRIEVRAVMPTSPPPAARAARPGPRLTLEDYLSTRNGDRR